MANLNEKQLQSFYARTKNNDREILNSDQCSCIFCRQTYSARDINDWVSNEDGTLNAICPICGMETVIGDRKQGKISHEDLKEINLRFFGEDYMQKNPEALLKYILRYKDGEISRKRENENLFKHYLTLLADDGDPLATYLLGNVFLYGTKWTKKDPQTALSLFTKPCLKTNQHAMTQIGQLLQSGYLKTVDDKKALEYYSKAMALNDELATMKFADCYSKGLGVEPDYDLARIIYLGLWSCAFQVWMMNEGKNCEIFGDLCYRLGDGYEHGIGTEKLPRAALRSYLLADYAFSLKEIDRGYHRDLKRNAKLVKEKIKMYAEQMGYKKGKPIGDFDTLSDSMLCSNGMMPPGQKYTLHIEDYDELSGELHFSIFSPKRQFIVDIANLYAGFVPCRTWWRGYGKIIESADEDSEFNTIRFEENDCIFINVTEDGENVVLHLEYLDEPDNEEAKKTLEDNMA